jgi:hypothetical protein
MPAYLSTFSLSTSYISTGLLIANSSILGVTQSKLLLSTYIGGAAMVAISCNYSGVYYYLTDSRFYSIDIPWIDTMSNAFLYDGWFTTLRNATMGYMNVTTTTNSINAYGYFTIPPEASVTLAFSPNNGGCNGWLTF